MKNLLIIAVIATLAFSCGEAGVGFNIGKEFPVSIPIEANNIPQPPIGVDPPAFTESTSYELDDVSTFSDYLENGNLEDVIIENISYAIEGVEPSEMIDLQDLSLTLIANGSNVGTVDVDGDLSGTLDNLAKTPISNLDSSALSEILQNGGTIEANVTFDFGELPPSSFDFDFVFYFDVVIKARDL